MIKSMLVLLAMLACTPRGHAQPTAAFADSIRRHYRIPELAYAVASSTEVLEMQVIGVKKAGATLAAGPDDRFRLGSNTKAITGFIAALLVSKGIISWDTRFFDLFPELKADAHRAYHGMTLLNLLTFRTRLPTYTYTNPVPVKGRFSGDLAKQRYAFVQWFLGRPPAKGNDRMSRSNVGYVAAGLMLEKATGKSYQTLVAELGQQLGISFGFGSPNAADTTQPWGHDELLIPEPPGDNYKLDWLLPAGNIHVSLPGYLRFIQLQLRGLAGRSTLLSQQEFQFLHTGLPGFSVGWFWQRDEHGRVFSNNTGNPGTFLSKVFVWPDSDRAFILFANAQSQGAEAGLDALYEALRQRYGK